MPHKTFPFTNLECENRPPTSPSLPIVVNGSHIQQALFDTGATGIFLPSSFSEYANPALLANAKMSNAKGVGGMVPTKSVHVESFGIVGLGSFPVDVRLMQTYSALQFPLVGLDQMFEPYTTSISVRDRNLAFDW